MSVIKGGVAAYKDCAELCETLLKRPFPREATDDLKESEVWIAEFAAKAVLTKLGTAFRQKARDLELLASSGGGRS